MSVERCARLLEVLSGGASDLEKRAAYRLELEEWEEGRARLALFNSLHTLLHDMAAELLWLSAEGAAANDNDSIAIDAFERPQNDEPAK